MDRCTYIPADAARERLDALAEDFAYMGDALEDVRECLDGLMQGLEQMPDKETSRRILEHYDKARRKHPHFADCLLDDCGEFGTRNMAPIVAKWRDVAERHRRLTPEMVLSAEVSEINDAVSEGDYEHAEEEVFDAIAVLLRWLDMIRAKGWDGGIEFGAKWKKVPYDAAEPKKTDADYYREKCARETPEEHRARLDRINERNARRAGR